MIDVSDQFAFSYVSNPVLGSNGETLFFVVEQMDYEPGISRFQIMRQALADGSVTELTADDHDSWQPVLSNDGRSLFFLSNRAGGTTQLWKKSLNDDGRAVQITDVEAGVDDINFSSDQTRLLLVRKDKKTSPPLVQGSQPWVIDRLSFKRDYEGYVTHQYDHIYVYDLRTQNLQQLTFGDYDDSEPTWSPDDRQVAFVSNRNADGTYDTDIWITNVEKGGEPTKLTKNRGADSSPQWHPDGASILTRSAKPDSYDNYAVSHLSRIDLATGKQTWLTEGLYRNVFQPVIEHEGRAVYFIVEDRGQQQLARM